MAVIDPDFTLHLSSAEIKKDALEALKNAIGAAAVPGVNDYAKGFAIEAACAIFQNLEKAMAGGAKEPVACENLANAAANAGIAYACAVQGGAPVDKAKTIEELISAATDKTVLVKLAEDCGLAGNTEYDTQVNLVAECKKVAAL
jgi:hypothetical protein